MARGVQEDDLVVSDHSALDCWLQLSICSSPKGGLMVSEWHSRHSCLQIRPGSPDQMTDINPEGACRGAGANS